MFAHHVMLEILGHEFEPHGVWQHAATFTGTAILLTLAGIGFATVFRKVSERRRRVAGQPAK